LGYEIIIPDDALPFAQIQIGELNALIGSADWFYLVHQLVQNRFESIKPYLPARCGSILDIGGGIAVSDIPIMKHYMSIPNLYVLDGDSETAHVVKHDEPFNCIAATDAMLTANGIKLTGYWTPHAIENWTHWKNKLVGKPFDLIVSFAAWGFHFFPDSYLKFVEANTIPGSRVILDLRIGKEHWNEQLQQQFKIIALAQVSRKFNRVVYERR
jgi:hypothetical protein